MLTDKQQSVLDTITEYISQYAKSPTIEELKDLLQQKSKRWVTQYLEVLEKKWFISRWSGFRSIRLGAQAMVESTFNIPILGYANAGTPMVDAVETDYGSLPISKNLVSRDEHSYFILKVEGTSMNSCEVNGKIIENGSYVLIDRHETVPNTKDPFVFVVNGAATLKKYKKDWQTIYLLPESKDDYHKPIILSEMDRIEVNGKIVDVFNF